MRKLAWIAVGVTVLAACSDDGGQQKASGTKAAMQLQPGQWEMTSEITNITMTQKGAPMAPIKAGTKVTIANCITPEQVKSPDATLFSGTKGSCKYDNFYMANGRLNAQMTCAQPGQQGNLMMNIDGTYTPTTMEVSSDLDTNVAGAGNMKMSSKLTGKRIGECTGEAPKLAAAAKS
jgi:hypothetical protein